MSKSKVASFLMGKVRITVVLLAGHITHMKYRETKTCMQVYNLRVDALDVKPKMGILVFLLLLLLSHFSRV